jgi:hypothetical protein
MGLPVSQRRNLAEIEGSLLATDPRLVSLLEIFTRLTRDEEMPRAEQLKAGAAVHLGAASRRDLAAHQQAQGQDQDQGGRRDRDGGPDRGRRQHEGHRLQPGTVAGRDDGPVTPAGGGGWPAPDGG